MRPHPILPAACVALLAIGQTASRPTHIGMLCATVWPTVVLDELGQLGWIEGSTILAREERGSSPIVLKENQVHERPTEREVAEAPWLN